MGIKAVVERIVNFPFLPAFCWADGRLPENGAGRVRWVQHNMGLCRMGTGGRGVGGGFQLEKHGRGLASASGNPSSSQEKV